MTDILTSLPGIRVRRRHGPHRKTSALEPAIFTRVDKMVSRRNGLSCASVKDLHIDTDTKAFKRPTIQKLTVQDSDFTGCYFEGFEISGDLDNVVFKNCTFSGLVIRSFSARRVTFENCSFNRVWMENSDLLGTTFKRVRLSHASIFGTRFSASYWDDCFMEGSRFHRVSFDSTIWDPVEWNSNYFREVTFFGASSKNVRSISDCDFSFYRNDVVLKALERGPDGLQRLRQRFLDGTPLSEEFFDKRAKGKSLMEGGTRIPFRLVGRSPAEQLLFLRSKRGASSVCPISKLYLSWIDEGEKIIKLYKDDI